MVGLGYTYGVWGNEVEARKILAEMLRESRRGYFPAWAIATVYVGLGDKDAAFQWFEKAVEERGELAWFKRDPLYDTVRSDPRFQDLLRRMNLAP
jgi:Tfp pilus assembly protein PilF